MHMKVSVVFNLDHCKPVDIMIGRIGI